MTIIIIEPEWHKKTPVAECHKVMVQKGNRCLPGRGKNSNLQLLTCYSMRQGIRFLGASRWSWPSNSPVHLWKEISCFCRTIIELHIVSTSVSVEVTSNYLSDTWGLDKAPHFYWLHWFQSGNSWLIPFDHSFKSNKRRKRVKNYDNMA